MLSERKDQWLRRIVNTVWYLLAASIAMLFRQKQDVVVAATTPPVLPAWLISTICRFRGTGFVYHYQDLHPESLGLVGTVRRPWLLRALRALDGAATRYALRRIVLSGDMGRALQERPGCGALDYTIINNFDPGDDAERFEPKRLPGKGTRILFAGNLGLFQGLERVIEAFSALGEQDRASLIFLGDGPLKSELMKRAGNCLGRSIFFLEQCSPVEAKRTMEAADLGLVSLSPGVIRYAYPSKVMVYLNAGLPILAMVERDSELARTIIEEDVGFVCPPDAPAQLTALPSDIPLAKESREALRDRCRELARRKFSRDRALQEWRALFDALG